MISSEPRSPCSINIVDRISIRSNALLARFQLVSIPKDGERFFFSYLFQLNVAHNSGRIFFLSLHWWGACRSSDAEARMRSFVKAGERGTWNGRCNFPRMIGSKGIITCRYRLVQAIQWHMSTSTNGRYSHSLTHGQAEAGSGDETRTGSGLTCMPCPSRRKLGWSGALKGQRSGLATWGSGEY